ncbi:MAG: type II secretion protein F [Alphaproteobacteria bacterium]|nr:MAG: type II secretion protein F [Alphaproteobacteria bacterium]
MTIIQIILIAAIVFLIVGVVMFIAMNTGAKQSKKNIEMIRGKSTGEVRVDEKDLQNKRRAEIARKLKSSKDEEGNKDKVSISLKLEQAGLSGKTTKFWVLSVVSCFAFLGLAKYLEAEPHILVMMGIVGFMGFPRFILRKMILKRQKEFLEEFSDALDAVVRLLQAGMPVGEAVLMISREFEGPVGEEMSIIYDKQKIGIPLHEAALEGTKRMPLPEMKMFAAGLSIQAQTGSSLSEVLTNLSRVIRARFRLKRKVMALSSEAIASASIIGALPPLVGAGLYAVNPDYLEPMFTTEEGRGMLMNSAIWMTCGVLVMKKMINFRI